MLLFGAIWTLGLWIGKATECCKWSLVGLASRSMEGSNAERCVDWRGPAQEVPEKNTISIGQETILIIF